MNRREFLIQTGAAASLATGGLLTRAGAGRAAWVVCDPTDRIAAGPAPQFALDQLRMALTARGFLVHPCARLDQTQPGDLCVVAAGKLSALARDAGAIPPATAEGPRPSLRRALGGRDVVVAAGNDARGLAYALHELADAGQSGGRPGRGTPPGRNRHRRAGQPHPQPHALLLERRRGQGLVPRPRLLAALSLAPRRPAVQPVQPRLRPRLRCPQPADGHLPLLRLPLPAVGPRLRRPRDEPPRRRARPEPRDAAFH